MYVTSGQTIRKGSAEVEGVFMRQKQVGGVGIQHFTETLGHLSHSLRLTASNLLKIIF